MALTFYEDVCCWYRIREGTKDELVGVESGGNVSRSPETHGDDQLWLVLPVGGKNKVKLMTKTKIDEYMAVGSDGNILRWSDTEGIEQEFWPANPTGDGWWNLYESTRNERVAVGSNGNIRRWKATGGVDQRFKFEAWQPPSRPQLQAPECPPGQIGDVPRMTGFTSHPPMTSRSVLVAETLLPATVVKDPIFPDRSVQMEITPYYIVRREQFWDRGSRHGFLVEHDGRTSRKFITELEHSVSTTGGSSTEETLGLEFGIEAGYAKKKSPISATLSSQFDYELSVQEYSESNLQRNRKSTYETDLPEGIRCTFVGWCLADKFTLLRYDRSEIISWKTWNPLGSSFVVDVYPPLESAALGTA